jgi:hypothetical protein
MKMKALVKYCPDKSSDYLKEQAKNAVFMEFI